MHTRRIRSVASFVAAIIVAGCCSSHATPEFGPGDAANAIAKRNERFAANVRRHDAAALVADFFAPDAIVLAPFTPPVRGTDAIVAFWQHFLGDHAVDATLMTEAVREADSGDLAVEIGSYEMTITPRSGGAAQHDSGKYVVTWQKSGGTWRALYDAFSSNAPPPMR
jgi:uncharacterized protein (TIGR02246 family)